MSTYNEILAAAYGRSSKNIPGKIATDATELLNLMWRALAGLYSAAADINPMFFAESVAVPFAAGGWARPTGAESVFRIEIPATGVEVVTVPIDDRAAESGKPALYRLGQKFITAGNALDPVAGNLTFFYSKQPTKPALLADNIDATWPETYNPLLINEVALWLAIKDGRSEEVGPVKEDRDSWLALFTAFLDHETTNEVRRTGTTFHSQRRVNIAVALGGAG